MLETKARGIPLVLINARMSSSSFKRWRRRPGLSRPIFSAFDLVLAQNDGLAERFAQLGAARALDVGNLKADAPPPPADLPGRRKLTAALADRSVWLAASTHPGEDDIVAAAHVRMRAARPDLLTIIVPRHPERGPLIADQLKAANLRVALRSEGKLPDATTDIYVADTIGELGLFYALAPVAFVGGSLAARGGQNPVEPIKLGAAVLTGPNFQNFRDSYGALLRAGGCKQVSDAASLAEAALALLEDAAARRAMTERASRAIAAMSGALPKTLAELERYPAAKDDAATCLLRRRSGGIAGKGVLASALAPLGRLYGRIAEKRFAEVEPYRSRLPVICIGNFTAGGGGKTPTAIAVAALLARARGQARLPHPRLWRSQQGAGARSSQGQSAAEVGDEPLLLAEVAPTMVVGRPRGRRQGDRGDRRQRHRHG